MLGYSWEWTYSKMYDGKYTIIQMDDPAMKEVPFEDRFGMLVDVEYSNRKNNQTETFPIAQLPDPDIFFLKFFVQMPEIQNLRYIQTK